MKIKKHIYFFILAATFLLSPKLYAQAYCGDGDINCNVCQSGRCAKVANYTKGVKSCGLACDELCSGKVSDYDDICNQKFADKCRGQCKASLDHDLSKKKK